MEKQLLEQLYETYYRELYLYVYSLLHNRSMAEDILQETFVKAMIALKDSHTNMRAWLYLVARNLCYNQLGREKRVILSGQSSEMERNRSSENDILEKMIADEQKKMLWKILEKLPEASREVILLQYFGGFRQKEIAAMMGLTPENVRVLAYRGKKAIRAYLEVENYDISRID